MNNMPAGGLRSRTIDRAIPATKTTCARRVGADPGDGLALAQWEHTGPHSRFARASILGPQASRRSAGESNRKRETSSRPRLLHEQRKPLGRSDSVRSAVEMERRTNAGFLEWSCCEGHTQTRKHAPRITLSMASHSTLPQQWEHRYVVHCAYG